MNSGLIGEFKQSGAVTVLASIPALWYTNKLSSEQLKYEELTKRNTFHFFPLRKTLLLINTLIIPCRRVRSSGVIIVADVIVSVR